MPSLEEMRALGQEIVASHRSRKGAIASLKGETRALMKELAEGSKARHMGVRIQLTGFHKDHQAMGKEVRAELAKAQAQLKAETKALMKEVAKANAQLKAETGALVRELNAEMEGARTGWQEGLGVAPSRPKPTPSEAPKPRPKSRRPPTG